MQEDTPISGLGEQKEEVVIIKIQKLEELQVRSQHGW